MKELPIGVYTIPQDCRAILVKGKVHVFQKIRNTLAEGEYRCKDCKHYVLGKTTINQSSFRLSYVCEMRPKAVANPCYKERKLFYAALKYGKLCDKFELREAE